MCCTDVISGIESLTNSSLQQYESQLHRFQLQQQQQQLNILLSPYSSTLPLQQGVPALAVSRGSFVRSSASSTEGPPHIPTGGTVTRVPQSILKQPTVSQQCDVTPNSSMHVTVPIVAQDAYGSASAGATPISAKSLQRTMPPGADLNDVISQVVTGRSVAPVRQNAATPIRKSSLVGARPGLSPSADVTRSTSLRQPAKSTADDWLPLRHGYTSTQLNLNNLPSPVEARFQRMPLLASPMKVTSNPVHNTPGAASVSSGRMTPPVYHPPPTYSRAPNVDQPTFSTGPQLHPQHPSHFGTAPVGWPQLESVLPSPLSVQSHVVSGDRYFDYLASESSANASMQLEPAANNTYLLVPYPLANTVESSPAQPSQLYPANAEQSQLVSTAAVRTVAPPSYEVAKSLKMNAALSSTPPANKRYFEALEASHQTRHPTQLTEQSNGIVAQTTASLVGLTNGDVHVLRSYVATPTRMTNERQEPVANGPMSYMSTPHSKPLPITQSASAPVNRHVSLVFMCQYSVHLD